MDYIGQFESLYEDFEEIRSRIGIKKSLPHLNKSKRDHYREYYDERTIEIIHKWFKEDIETFGYKF